MRRRSGGFKRIEVGKIKRGRGLLVMGVMFIGGGGLSGGGGIKVRSFVIGRMGIFNRIGKEKKNCIFNREI